ncbi:LPXTG cell wall anchor domain-containing protein [Streptococcus dentasini]
MNKTNKTILLNATEKLNGHGSYRKRGKQLLGTLVVSGVMALGAGTVVSADEAAPAESTQTGQTIEQASVADQNTQAVTVDNSSVEAAAANAQQAGVEVTQAPAQDMGVAQNDQDLATKQADIAADQANQVQNLQTAQAQATETHQAYQEAKQAVETTNQAVDQAAQDYKDYVADVKTEPVSQGKTVEDYHSVRAQARGVQKQNQTAVDQLNKQLTDYLNSTAFTASMTETTQNVDSLKYGNSEMHATVDSATGVFELTHDMNDGDNDRLGNLGTGVLNGKLNWHSASNGDGSQTITIDSVDLGQYVYTNHRPSTAVNKSAEMVVKDLNGTIIWRSGIYNVDNNLTQTINTNTAINKSVKVAGNGAQSELLEVLKVDDNWIINTHGQVQVQFQTDNKAPDKITLVKLTTPAEPEPVKASYHSYQLAVKVPETPAPQPEKTTPSPQQAPAEPVKAAALPQTGDKKSVGLAGLGAIFVGLSALGAARFKLKIKETN